jgi:hypothetical protein
MNLYTNDNQLIEHSYDYIRKHRLAELFEVNSYNLKLFHFINFRTWPLQSPTVNLRT